MGRVAVYRADRYRLREIQAALTGLPHVLSRTSARFEQDLRTALCSVVTCRRISTALDPAWLCDLLQRFPDKGWILVTEFDPTNVRVILEQRVSVEAVWFFEMEQKLRNSILRWVRSDPLFRLSTRLSRETGLDEHLAQTLVEVLRMARPPRTVSAVANSSGLTRDQLRYRWFGETGGGLSLRRILDQVFTVKLIQARLISGSWKVASEAMKVDPRTVRNLRQAVLKELALADAELGLEGLYDRLVRLLEEQVERLLAG
jgi:hypothetical protein